MSRNRSWNILNWNIRGLNSPEKWLAIRQKIDESAAGILCLQETKRQNFDLSYIQNFCPQRFNKFEYLPSNDLKHMNNITAITGVLNEEAIFKKAHGLCAGINLTATLITNKRAMILTYLGKLNFNLVSWVNK